MDLGKFEGLGVGFGSGPPDYNPSKPLEGSVDVQSSKRGVYNSVLLVVILGINQTMVKVHQKKLLGRFYVIFHLSQNFKGYINLQRLLNI